MAFIKRMSGFVVVYAGAIGVASIPRVTESLRYEDYNKLLLALAQNGGKPSTLSEIVVALMGFIIYCVFNLPDQKFVRHSFWSHIFSKFDEKYSKDHQSTKATSENTSAVETDIEEQNSKTKKQEVKAAEIAIEVEELET